MQRLISFGLITVACALSIACGDDTGPRMIPTGGSGGGGGGGGGNNGGNGGGGAGGAVNTPASCSGCVEMTVPLTADAASRQAQFLFRPAMVVDMSETVITWRVKVITPASEVPGEQMFVATFAQNGEALAYAGAYAAQVALTPANGFTNDETWVNIVQDIANFGEAPPPPPADAGAADGGADAGDAGGGSVTPPAPPDSNFDKTQVFQYGLYVGALAGTAGTVRVALDSVTFEGGAFTDVNFTAGAENFTADPYMQPPGTTLVHRP